VIDKPGGGEGGLEFDREPARDPAGVRRGVRVALRLAEDRSKSTAPIKNTTGSVKRIDTEVETAGIIK
jgi:hypothetical protein